MNELLEDAKAFACLSALMLALLWGFRLACLLICKLGGWM